MTSQHKQDEGMTNGDFCWELLENFASTLQKTSSAAQLKLTEVIIGIEDVKALAKRLNDQQIQESGNYFINVIHYADNRSASYARNTGFNYSTADWILLLDDDVIPTDHLLDAYIGAIYRYPDAKVFVGCTELPESHSIWTKMLCTCNVGYCYGIEKGGAPVLGSHSELDGARLSIQSDYTVQGRLP